jgi:hypothetical protein
VLRELRKKATVLESVNTAVRRMLNPAEVAWDIVIGLFVNRYAFGRAV